MPDTSKIGEDINKNCKLKTVVDLVLILIVEVFLRYRSRSQGMTILHVFRRLSKLKINGRPVVP
ncbi:MAG TPA: hypothetical protein VJ767_01960 [Nitrososphaeraceae archaeon]|nr:hypothetical protein [Nitrososphaeraceae archaeon]